MQNFVSIAPGDLCQILTKAKSELTQFELALREALEKSNTEDELRAIREYACISAAVPAVQLTTKGKLRL